MPLRTVPLLLLVAALPAAEIITVVGEPEPPLPLPPGPDPAAGLRLLPGLDGIRMGGLGLDPVVRGQSGPRLLVTADGACPQGGCPNRMDPPTSYAPAGADRVRVEPGGLSVRHPGAPVGVIALERPAPRFADGRWHEAAAWGRVQGNGAQAELGAALALGGRLGFVQARAEAARGDDYEDGDGREVRSAYRSAKGGGTLGWTPDESTRAELSHDLVRDQDVLYAGAGMDATRSDGDTTVLRLRTRRSDGLLAAARLDAWLSAVEHDMDNYSLRPATGMLMRAPSTSDSRGLRAAGELRLGGSTLALGLDAGELAQDARRYSGVAPGAVDNLNSLLWPDVRQRRLGLWSDLALPLSADWQLVPGLRWDAVESRADAAAVDPPGMPLSPDGLYALYYGERAAERREHLWGAAVRLERHLGDTGLATLALSRQMRAADPTERFIAANAATAAQRWVGNPGLEAETHWQAQAIVADDDGERRRWRLEAWADRVQDCIRRDRARGQDGVLLADQATVYRNGEALLLGAVAAGEAEAAGWLGLSADLAWTWGKDLGTGLPLPQIPPLSGSLAARLGPPDLCGVLRLRWAARATRVDADPATGSALDAGETPAWAVLDLRGEWHPTPDAELAIGVDNCFDRTYAEHLNKPSAFDTTVVRVNEPGLSAWASARLNF